MNYSRDEVMQYVSEDDVKFIRLAFCDVFGKQKNISIMPSELARAFEYGIAFDASSITGFGDVTRSDLFLRPDSSTIMALPWRPEHGKVVRMFSSIHLPSGKLYECDTRSFLKKAIADAASAGISFSFGAEQEFYLFKLDENGLPTNIPYDQASYMDLAPDDRGENVRREICLTLEQMGVCPESSHHEDGPGQNEINFCYSDPLTTADNVMTLQTVVKTVAQRNGLFASFSPKPLHDKPGNGFHINISVQSNDPTNDLRFTLAGIMDKINELTAFLNPCPESFLRFGVDRAPSYVTWSSENRSQLIRIPAANGEYCRAELRSPDPSANPYLAFALLIYAGLYGKKNELELPEPANFNIYTANAKVLSAYKKLPDSFKAACAIANESEFIEQILPFSITDVYCKN